MRSKLLKKLKQMRCVRLLNGCKDPVSERISGFKVNFFKKSLIKNKNKFMKVPVPALYHSDNLIDAIPETPPLKITNFMQYQLMKHG